MADVDVFSSTSLNFLRRFYLNPRSYQFIGFEALIDCVIHKVKGNAFGCKFDDYILRNVVPCFARR